MSSYPSIGPDLYNLKKLYEFMSVEMAYSSEFNLFIVTADDCILSDCFKREVLLSLIEEVGKISGVKAIFVNLDSMENLNKLREYPVYLKRAAQWFPCLCLSEGNLLISVYNGEENPKGEIQPKNYRKTWTLEPILNWIKSEIGK